MNDISPSQIATVDDITLTKGELDNFTGTQNWYSMEPLSSKIIITDGVMHVVQTGGAAWLVTDIIAAQLHPKVEQEDFQVWKLTVNEDKTAVITCGDGNDNIVYTQKYGYTNFPLDEITFWLTTNVMLLPSEY